MSGSGLKRWFRVAFDDVVLVLRSVVRPWTDLQAVRATQVDVVKAVASQQHDIASALAAVKALGDEVARLKALSAEQEAVIRQLHAKLEQARRPQVLGAKAAE